MGLETDITDIQSLNQNWPPVSDPRAQGADHIRNIKKAIQLTFPNLKQCLLNDAQFTALGAFIGDGSGTFTINGKLTVSDTLTVKGTSLVPAVTDWTTQQAVGAKDAEGRYLKPGDADGLYVGKAKGDQDYTPIQAGIQISTSNIWLNYKASDGTVKYVFAQPAGDYATNAALTDAKNSCLANNNPGISGALAGTSLCVNPADGLPYLAYNGNSKIVALALDSAKVNKADGSMSALNVQGGSFQMNNAGAPGYATWFRDTSTATDGVLDISSNVGGSDTNVLRITSDGGINILGSGTFQKNGSNVAFQSDIPSLPGNTLQVWHVDNVASMSTINFPRAFSSAPLAIWCQDMDGTNVDNATIRNRTRTGFQVQTGNNDTRNITFFALGDI